MLPIRAHERSRPFRRKLAKRLAQVKSLARREAQEGEGPATESLERYRRATLGAIAGVTARAASLVTVFISIPLVLGELGPQQFGIWATLASVAVLLNFADLGISNGLVNMLVSADVENDHRQAAEHVTSALALLTGIAALLAMLFAAVYGAVDWTAVYNTGSSVDANVAARATAVFAGCFLALLPLGLFQRVHLGYQEGLLAYGWTAAGSIFGLFGVLAAGLAHASLPWFVAATSGGPVISALLNGVVLLGRSRPWLRPRLSRVTKRSLRTLASTGGTFFLIQSSSAIAYYSGPIVVAQIEGAAAVKDFAVPMRVFAFLPVLFSIAMTAAWPSLRSAVLKGDIGWVRRALKRVTWLGLCLMAPPTLGLVIFGDAALRLWTGDKVGAPTLVLVSFGAWAVLSAMIWPLWTILVATNSLRAQAAMSVLMAVATVVLSVELTQGIGVAGVVIGMTLAQAVFFVLPATIYVAKLLRRLEVGNEAPHPNQASAVQDGIKEAAPSIGHSGN